MIFVALFCMLTPYSVRLEQKKADKFCDQNSCFHSAESCDVNIIALRCLETLNLPHTYLFTPELQFQQKRIHGRSKNLCFLCCYIMFTASVESKDGVEPEAIPLAGCCCLVTSYFGIFRLFVAHRKSS